jgi:exodeoxyribonuclease V gamma subunit
LLEELKRSIALAEPLPTTPRSLSLSDEQRSSVLNSVRLHNCHSALRQVEALYQAINASVRRDPTLHPRDFLVLCADIEGFVPLIEAVFHGREGRLGAEISRPHGLNPFSDLLTQLMQLSLGRAYRYDVFQLLKLPLVSERFKLSLADILSLEAWLKRAGVRWGVDGAHRARFGLPPDELNTWTFGLDRLLLGALVGDDVSLFKGISPSALGEDEALLAKFLDFFVVLKELIQALWEPATPKAWAQNLTRAARCLSAPNEETRWLLQELESDLYHTLARHAGQRPLSPQAITRALEGGLGRKPMLTGGGGDLVRFYPLDQAYALPSKVICLLDMSDGRFPLPFPPNRLDPLTLAPLPTDRHRGFEQLSHVGLSMLAAERELHVFYTGRTPVGEPLEPAPVVLALIEELRGRFSLGEGALSGKRDLISAITTQHPLHPFSPQGFVGDEEGNPTEETLSHEPRWLKGAEVWREAQRNPIPRPPFALGGVEEPARQVKRARVETLRQLLKNPSEFFLKRGVGMSLSRDELVTRERELLELDGLQSWSLRHRTLELALALEEEGRPLGDEVKAIFERVRAEGLLPAGKMGVVSFEQSFEGVAALVERFKDTRDGRPKTPVALSLSLPSGRSLRVEKEELYEDRLIFTTPSNHLGKEGPRGKRLLEPWLYHVAMSASGRPYQGASLVAADGSFDRFPPLDQGNAQRLLDGWLVGLEAGLLRPLRFDPELSWSYLEGRRKGDPLKELNSAWGYSSLQEDLYAKRAFEGEQIWGGAEIEPEFEQTAELYYGALERAVYEPEMTPIEALSESLKAARPVPLQEGTEPSLAGEPDE